MIKNKQVEVAEKTPEMSSDPQEAIVLEQAKEWRRKS